MTIIAICGLISSGKDTVADYLVAQHGFVRDSFASSLKDSMSSIFGWDRALLEGRDPEARAWREQVDSWWSQRLGIPQLSPRWVMQNLGTNTLRQHFHDDLWIASLERRLSLTRRDTVISDCRFPNEIRCLRALGAQVLRVQRGEDPEWFHTAALQNQGLVHPETMQHWFPEIHISEWAWAGTRFDHVLDNRGSLANLYGQVNNLVRGQQVPTPP
jgi:hypothetical protein